MMKSSRSLVHDRPGLGRFGLTPAAVAVSTLVALAGCGGGGGGGDPAPPLAVDAIPATASQSVAGLNTYVTALAQTSTDVSDSREPLSVDGFTPMMSDDSEPAAVVVTGA